MTLEEIREICLEFKGTSEDVKWENDLCFLLGEKMFAVASLDKTPVAASFKTTAEHFDQLVERPGFKPAPYLARYKWVYIEDVARIHPDEWRAFAKGAYDLVAAKLPARVKKKLGL